MFGGVALALGAVGLIYPMRGSQYLSVKYHFEIAAWPMAFGVLCEFAKPWFLEFRAPWLGSSLVRGGGFYGRRYRYAVWNGSEETCHRHRRIAVFSVLVELFVRSDGTGSDWALACVVREREPIRFIYASSHLRFAGTLLRCCSLSGPPSRSSWGRVVCIFELPVLSPSRTTQLAASVHSEGN